MEQGTVALIQQLAAKLGTTSEYLWEVLIRQAPISAAIDFAQYIAIAVAVYFYVRFICAERDWENAEAPKILIAVIGGVLTVIFVSVVFFSIGNSITALVNPEYWALHKVLSIVKPK